MSSGKREDGLTRKMYILLDKVNVLYERALYLCVHICTCLNILRNIQAFAENHLTVLVK